MIGRMTRTREGGSVATFVVVALVFAALVIGGVFIVQKSGQEAPTKPPGATPQPSTPVAKSPSPSPAPKKTQKPSPAPTIRPPVTGTAPSQPLPKTGPSDDMVGIVMFAILVGMVTAYGRSRTHRATYFYSQQVD